MKRIFFIPRRRPAVGLSSVCSSLSQLSSHAPTTPILISNSRSRSRSTSRYRVTFGNQRQQDLDRLLGRSEDEMSDASESVRHNVVSKSSSFVTFGKTHRKIQVCWMLAGKINVQITGLLLLFIIRYCVRAGNTFWLYRFRHITVL